MTDWRRLIDMVIWLPFAGFAWFERYYWWWFYGLYQTVVAFITSHRPCTFNHLIKDEIEAADGERYVVWWCPSSGGGNLRSQFVKSGDDSAVTNTQHCTFNNKMWILLPGGMLSGNTPYMWDAVASGVLGDDSWCIFHNPGIVNRCRKRPPPAATDTRYLEQFVIRLKKHKIGISIMGFSVGSMLAIAMAKTADQMDEDSGMMKHEMGLAVTPELKTLDCCVAIHGPDRVRDIFEHLSANYSRLDIPFALAGYRTFCRSGIPEFLPENAGGGLHKKYFPWLRGWKWMKAYVESALQCQWADMEEAVWSNIPHLSKGPLSTPVFRVLSLNDPIVDFAHCCDTGLFKNVDKMYLQPKAGHCCAFRYDKELASVIRQWRNDKMGRCHAISSNGRFEYRSED